MMDLKKNEAVETKADCKDAAATAAESAQEVACASTAPAAEERPMPKDGEFDWTVQYCDEFYDQYIQNFQQNKKRRLFFRFVKRAFDFFVALFCLILFSPVMLVIAIAIKLDSRGPIVFKQQRVGRNGKPFNCYKFRSMKITTPRNMPTSQLAKPEMYVTRVGWVLRKLSLDELPQLFCCLVGTMSFIGPRPLVLNEVKCHDMRERLGVYRMRPGISGYAQVNGRDDVYYKNKAIMDAQYVRDASLWMDFKLLFLTVAVVFKRKGNNTGKRVTKTVEDSKDAE
jgi:O-antigen biosynthesis protein WbqP